jgi:hypothetical protein
MKTLKYIILKIMCVHYYKYSFAISKQKANKLFTTLNRLFINLKIVPNMII